MNEAQFPHLDIDLDEVKSRSEYKEVWRRIAPVAARNITTNEKCCHAEGDTFLKRNHYDKPEGICSALHHVLQLYLWRASVGFPSWEPDDPRVYRIHCPAKKGTVWELRRAADNGAPHQSQVSTNEQTHAADHESTAADAQTVRCEQQQ